LRRTGQLGAVAFLSATLTLPALHAQEAVDETNGAAERCRPCVGLLVEEPAAFAANLTALDAANGPLFLAWPVDLAAADTSIARAQIETIAASGAVPWLVARFASPPPLIEAGDRLEAELERLAALVGASPPGTVVQVAWPPLARPETDLLEYAFLIKRAAVAISGAQPDALVFADRVPTDVAWLTALYGDDLAAYLDGLTSERGEDLPGLAQTLIQLDPGSELARVRVTAPAEPAELLATVARAAESGASFVLVGDRPMTTEEASRFLAPWRVLAAELRGDVTFDPYSTPTGAPAWSFVRGSDLGLRVIVDPPSSDELVLELTDRLLTSPRLIDPTTGETRELFGGQRTRGGYRLRIQEPPPAFLLAFERTGVEALEGVEGVSERLEVEDARQIPVGEILRRLQAFEDAQARRLDAYTATNTLSLRFQLGGGVQSLDTTFSGPLFFRQGEPWDWAWSDFYVNGVRWRGKKLPEIPLIQPEKASSMPLEITFTKDYRYRLRGTATIDGRDCWVVDFEPAIKPAEGQTLFQGTVWVDREIYARVRTRGIQLGLVGDVLSNEETLHYQPLDAAGASAAWTPDAFYLPVRTVGQQLFSILKSTTVVEREVTLSQIRINPADFDQQRQATLDSQARMVRDTDRGLRYLVVDKETGDRMVEEEPDPTRLFIVGGAFYDESFDFPLPLAGLNWTSFDFRGTGSQVNLFFAGPLLTLDYADPDFLGSKFDVGVDAFALAIRGTDSVFRGDLEIPEEDVESNRPNIDFSLGRPFGSFFKLDLRYSLGWTSFARADDTADDVVLPENHLSQSVGLIARYNRRGYRLRLGGSYNLRSDWEPWGRSEDGVVVNPEFDPDQERYTLYSAGIGKTWHLPKFQKVGIDVEYLRGEDLDRFSKLQFGFFSDVRVHGYRQDRVRATEAWAAHVSYGFDIASIFRVDLVGDAAWATDRDTGLDQELLAGAGLVGTFIGPWGTVVNFDIGVPVAGPDDGFSAYVAFLKLFR
jgi:hypothetical protein